jgi:esterase/lipase
MGSAAVQEAHGLLLGFDGLALGVSGYSMGGNIAALVAATHPGPLVAVPMAPSPSPAVVFTEGLLSRFVDWKALGSSPSDLAAVLDRASVLALPPPVRSDLAIIVATRGDGYIPAHAAEAIHRHWEGSELRWETGGHLSMATMARTHLSQAVVDGFNRAG